MLAGELEKRLPGSARSAAEVALKKARLRDMGVTARELAVIVHLVDEPAVMTNPPGFYVAALEGLIGSMEHRIVRELETGRRDDARELLYDGRTKKIQTVAAAWLELVCGEQV